MSGKKKKMACFRSTWLVCSNGFFATQRSSEGSSNMAFQMVFQKWLSRHDLPDMAFQDGQQAGIRNFQKHGFVIDSDSHGSKSRSEGIPWQFFSSPIFLQAPIAAIMTKMIGKNRGFGPGRVGILRTSPGMIRNGPPGPWEYYLGVWGPLGLLFGGLLG